MAEHPDPISQTTAPTPGTASFARVPDHELIRLIGKGSYGEVWLGRNTLGAFRAVKIVYAQTFRHRRPFEREFNGVLKFEPISRLHEGLMDVLQVGRNDEAGYFYCVMELADDVVSGQAIDPAKYTPRTLAHDLAKLKRLPLEECRRVVGVVASALDFLHGHGLIHRDIKPANIVFVNGVPMLADIGLVAELSEAKSYVGTEGFIPPEGPGTVQADIYSLGKVLYEIHTGKDRHDYPDLPTRMGNPPEEQQAFELNKIILKACRADPHERYESAREMVEDLIALQQGREVAAQRGIKRLLPITLAAGVIMLAIAGASWLYLRPTKNVSNPARLAAGTAEKPSSPLAAGLISRWSGEDDARDSVGTSHGILMGGVTFTNGVRGRAFLFDGTNGNIVVPDAPSLNFGSNQDFSIEAWISPLPSTTDYDVMSIMDKRLATNRSHPDGQGYEFNLNAGQIHARLSDSMSSSGMSLGPAGADMRDGRFHHVVLSVARSYSTGGAIFIDGQRVLLFDPTGLGDLSNAEPLRIGRHASSFYDTDFNGRMDEVSLYRRALSALEVAAHYRSVPAADSGTDQSADLELVLPVKSKYTPGDQAGGILNGVLRQQNVYAASQFPAGRILIKGLRLRPWMRLPPVSLTISNIQFNFSTTAAKPDALGKVFAENVGADDTVVFRGSLAISSASTNSPGEAKQFDIIVPLTQPFLYDPAKGNLMLEVRNYSGGSFANIEDIATDPHDNASRAFTLDPQATIADEFGSGATIVKLVYSRIP